MTSSKPSDQTTESTASPILSSTADGICAKCSGPTRLRNARPFPVLLQVVFGLSFAAFLWVQSGNTVPTKALWLWSVFQIILGALLVRARYAAAKKVFICLRCGPPLG